MKAKHTKEYAEELAYEMFEKMENIIPFHVSDNVKPYILEGFEKMYLKAIEETNHIELLEICKNIRPSNRC